MRSLELRSRDGVANWIDLKRDFAHAPLQRSVPTRFPDWNTFHSSSVSGAPTSGSGARSGSTEAVACPLVEAH